MDSKLERGSVLTYTTPQTHRHAAAQSSIPGGSCSAPSSLPSDISSDEIKKLLKSEASSQSLDHRDVELVAAVHRRTTPIQKLNAPSRGVADLCNIPGIAAATATIPTVKQSDAKPIKRLSIKHRRMIALHLQGYTYAEIAGDIGCSPITVGAVIRNPTARGLIELAYRECDEGLKALMPLSVQVIRRGLVSGDPKVALGAVDRLYRALGKYRDIEAAEQTAEDVIRRIIQIRHGGTEITIAEEISS